MGHFVKQVPCKGELCVPQVSRNHGVVRDRVSKRHGVEDTESQVAVAIAHVGRDGFGAFHSVWVFEMGFWIIGWSLNMKDAAM